MGSDVEKIFEKGEEGMQNAEGFIKQMVRSLSELHRSADTDRSNSLCRKSERPTLKVLITSEDQSFTFMLENIVLTINPRKLSK